MSCFGNEVNVSVCLKSLSRRSKASCQRPMLEFVLIAPGALDCVVLTNNISLIMTLCTYD